MKNNFDEKTVFLIDGSSFLYRAYYSMRPLHTSKGIAVQAVYGFSRMIKKLIDTYKPKNMILIWDSKGKTERHEIFEDYKATRQAPPNDLFEQKALIKKFANKINLHQLEEPGIEADDLIYSAAKDLTNDEYNIAIVSSDKDLYQLLNKNTKVIDPFKDRVVTKEDFEQEREFSVKKLPFYHALLGDSSDNIPGVKGIGKKGASDLVKEFESLEDLYNKIESVKKDRTKKALLENKDNAFLSLKLFLLRYSPLSLKPSEVEFKIENWKNALPFFKEMEFKSLVKDLEKEYNIKSTSEKKSYFFEEKNISFKSITEQEDLNNLVKNLERKSEFAVDTETTGYNVWKSKCVGISISYQIGEAFYIPLNHKQESAQLSLIPSPEEQTIDITPLKKVLENPNIKKILQNAKFDILVFYNIGINIQGVIFDTMIAANLVTQDWQSIGLSKLSKLYLDDEMLTYADVVKANKYKDFSEVPLELATKYAASDAHQTLALKKVLEKKLKDLKLEDLFYKIEMPLMQVLTSMEIEGIIINQKSLIELANEIEKEIEGIKLKIKALIGEDTEINLNSPKQVENLLFNVLLLPPLKKSGKKTGYSTDSKVLEELSKMHPVPGLILKYRELNKLLTTYVQALPKYLTEDKKIHTTFSQTSTSTGRLASSEPNLQNIPADSSKFSQTLRSAFTPKKDHLFLSADYSQIELRVLAYFSQDKNLIDAFLSNKDIHTITAAKIFEKQEADISYDERQVGKRINFSILYGLTPYGLSQDLKIPVSDAKTYIERYFNQYPQVMKWMDQVIKETKEKGYVETYFKRRRYIPGIYEKNKNLYEFAKRAAINTVAQGTASEIMKVGMATLEAKLQNLDASIILQIHDELLISAHKDIIKSVENITKETLEKVITWSVPLLVQTKTGKNWLEVSK